MNHHCDSTMAMALGRIMNRNPPPLKMTAIAVNQDCGYHHQIVHTRSRIISFCLSPSSSPRAHIFLLDSINALVEEE